jgi:hypothetical protein
MLKTEHTILTQTWNEGDTVTTITYNVILICKVEILNEMYVETYNRIWKKTFTRIYNMRQLTISEKFIDTPGGSYSA